MKRLKKVFASALGLMMVTSMMPTTLLATETSGVAISQENFPDDNFRKYVSTFDLDKNGSLSTDERNNVKIIDYDSRNNVDKKLKNVKGIEYFTELENLVLDFNELEKLELDNPKLKEVFCANNKLTKLSITSEYLTRLLVYNNKLKTLELTNPNLKYLACTSNELTSLIVTSDELRIMDCADNHLTSLELNNPKLYVLNCSHNALSTLTIKSDKVARLHCYDNNLNSFDTTHFERLTTFDAFGNNFNKVDKVIGDNYYYFPRKNKMDVRENFDYTKVETLDKFLERIDGFELKNLILDLENKTMSLAPGANIGNLILKDSFNKETNIVFYYGDEPADPNDKPIVKPEVKPSDPENKPIVKPETKPTDTKKPVVVEDQKVPQTSDTSNMVAYISMMLLAAATGFVAYKHKEVE